MTARCPCISNKTLINKQLLQRTGGPVERDQTEEENDMKKKKNMRTVVMMTRRRTERPAPASHTASWVIYTDG